MEVNLQPKGTCSKAIRMDLEDGKIHNLRFTGGCPGNAIGIAQLVEGMDAQEAIQRLKGVPCGSRGTSCPDQLARGLEMVLASQKKAE